MNFAARYIALVLGILISFHYILSFTNESYGSSTSLSKLASKFSAGRIPPTYDIPYLDDNWNDPFPTASNPISGGATSGNSSFDRANATFVILARNSDLSGTVQSIREVEDKFNRVYNYPYVFLNEEPFSDEFKERISVLTSAKVEFGLVPKEHWYQPDWIDEANAAREREKMVSNRVIYGGSVSYRNMCRYNSGFFFKHPLLQKYRWYWRVEPDVHFHCNVLRDPFKYMEQHDKVYSFTITMYEFQATIPSLWDTVKAFIRKHPEYVAKDNSMNYMSDDKGETYNLCHFWSNFEIADMDFWRSQVYQDFFNYLDKTGGFYYERWGDAPVHSIAAGLFLPKDKIQFFDEIGYEHNPYTHCPRDKEVWRQGKCSCAPNKNFDYDGYSCMRQWDRIH
ncbi:glycosyltransferase family 15 protein [Flagelloscypha sp. PMI_526]|nr:glycosyltransferase family 15 protein [Flagelloscypha sp. PMI_526]KAH8801923.1 glycosyltransferase family 15 protein [Flagelloscypha sp. PMI_526]